MVSFPAATNRQKKAWHRNWWAGADQHEPDQKESAQMDAGQPESDQMETDQPEAEHARRVLQAAPASGVSIW